MARKGNLFDQNTEPTLESERGVNDWSASADCRCHCKPHGFVTPWAAMSSLANWDEQAETPQGLPDGDQPRFPDPYVSPDEGGACDIYGRPAGRVVDAVNYDIEIADLDALRKEYQDTHFVEREEAVVAEDGTFLADEQTSDVEDGPCSICRKIFCDCDDGAWDDEADTRFFEMSFADLAMEELLDAYSLYPRICPEAPKSEPVSLRGNYLNERYYGRHYETKTLPRRTRARTKKLSRGRRVRVSFRKQVRFRRIIHNVFVYTVGSRPRVICH